MGGFTRAGRAAATVSRYDPRANAWRGSAAMGEPRAYCKVAAAAGKLYAVGGVDKLLPHADGFDASGSGSGSTAMGGGLVPLRSAEAYDPISDRWQPIPSMPFSRAQSVARAAARSQASTAAAAHQHPQHHQHQHQHQQQQQQHQQPMASGIAVLRGRLCVPHSLYSWPFFVDAGGELFDIASQSWLPMPPGMADGWPAPQAAAKPAVAVAGRLLALDPSSPHQHQHHGCCSNSSSIDSSSINCSSSIIRAYDELTDSWIPLPLPKLPVVLDDFSASDCPFLLASLRTGLHVVTKDIDDCIVVLRLAASSPTSPATAGSSWKIVATKKFASVDLLTCQVLEV
jgi:hypothetical protein